MPELTSTTVCLQRSDGRIIVHAPGRPEHGQDVTDRTECHRDGDRCRVWNASGPHKEYYTEVPLCPERPHPDPIPPPERPHPDPIPPPDPDCKSPLEEAKRRWVLPARPRPFSESLLIATPTLSHAFIFADKVIPGYGVRILSLSFNDGTRSAWARVTWEATENGVTVNPKGVTITNKENDWWQFFSNWGQGFMLPMFNGVVSQLNFGSDRGGVTSTARICVTWEQVKLAGPHAVKELEGV